tara:strand:- start:520 stop:735 length:216 start_codon:yes stop_codon:yes gene_type:complete
MLILNYDYRDDSFGIAIGAMNETGLSEISELSELVYIPTITQYLEAEKEKKRKDAEKRRTRRMSKHAGAAR